LPTVINAPTPETSSKEKARWLAVLILLIAAAILVAFYISVSIDIWP